MVCCYTVFVLALLQTNFHTCLLTWLNLRIIKGASGATSKKEKEAKAKDKKKKVTKSKTDDKDAEDEEVCSEAPKKRPRTTKK